MKRNRLLKIGYIVLQTVFLPVLLKMDEVQGLTFVACYVGYTALVILDAYLALLLFGRK